MEQELCLSILLHSMISMPVMSCVMSSSWDTCCLCEVYVVCVVNVWVSRCCFMLRLCCWYDVQVQFCNLNTTLKNVQKILLLHTEFVLLKIYHACVVPNRFRHLLLSFKQDS